MSRYCRFGVGVVVLAAVVWSGCGESHPPGYFESRIGIGLQMPEGWTPVESEDDPILVLKGPGDSNAPVVSIVLVEPLPEAATDALFHDLNVRDAQQSDGFHPIRQDSLVAFGRTLPALVYAYRIEDTWHQALLASAVIGEGEEKRGYVINCISRNNRFEGDKQGFRKVGGKLVVNS